MYFRLSRYAIEWHGKRFRNRNAAVCKPVFHKGQRGLRSCGLKTRGCKLWSRFVSFTPMCPSIHSTCAWKESSAPGST